MLRQYELVDLVKSYDPYADEDALNLEDIISEFREEKVGEDS